eukprot:361755-Chlamydomonas_euryale.AAC.2
MRATTSARRRLSASSHSGASGPEPAFPSLSPPPRREPTHTAASSASPLEKAARTAASAACAAAAAATSGVPACAAPSEGRGAVVGTATAVAFAFRGALSFSHVRAAAVTETSTTRCVSQPAPLLAVAGAPLIAAAGARRRPTGHTSRASNGGALGSSIGCGAGPTPHALRSCIIGQAHSTRASSSMPASPRAAMSARLSVTSAGSRRGPASGACDPPPATAKADEDADVETAPSLACGTSWRWHSTAARSDGPPAAPPPLPHRTPV